MDAREDLIRRREAVMPDGIPRISDLAIASARGATLVGVDGSEYLDLATGIGVMSIGHSRAEVVKAVQDQMEELQHLCIHVATYEPYIALAERLTQLFPHGDRTKAMLLNSGAEAVENAIKIARQFTGRSAVIAFSDAFHGRTMMSMTLTSKSAYKVGCGPYAPEVYRLPFPNVFARGRSQDVSAFVAEELDRFRNALLTLVPGEEVAAVILELVQGEGGFNVVPAEYLRGLRSLCDEHGIVLIFDEVQTGFCRTGRWGAYHHFNVTPDISTWAKAMGGGLPISAVVGRADVMDGARKGTIGGTFGGNPVACAAALATIDLMEAEGMADRATKIGDRIQSRLQALAAECSAVVDVRGLGAMQAIELNDPDGRPATDLALAAVRACHESGVLVIRAGTHANIIRLLPPLCITNEELDRGLDVLARCVTAAAGAGIGTHA